MGRDIPHALMDADGNLGIRVQHHHGACWSLRVEISAVSLDSWRAADSRLRRGHSDGSPVVGQGLRSKLARQARLDGAQ